MKTGVLIEASPDIARGPRSGSCRLRRAHLIAALGALIGAPVVADAAPQNYVVLYQQYSVPGTVAKAVATAGGTLVAAYGPIGVAIARSDSPAFAQNMRSARGVQATVATAAFGVRPADMASTLEPAGGEITAPVPAPGSDSLSGLQWDMAQISAPEARAINGGSPSIVVGNIDTGIDYTHPDLAPNIDLADSANCVGGVPVPGAVAANDDNGHGTFTAGIIAAALNGIGIVGVAPNARIAGIKAGNADGFFFPEAVICAFMWAGSRNLPVLHNGYYVDPWLYDCRNDPEQRAIWEAVRRAIAYAMKKGAVVIAAAGNFSDDLARPTQDVSSPDDSTPITRSITNACSVLPVEIPGVVGVTANGNLELKSYYANYGLGAIQLIAPGGDSRLQLTSAAPNGRVLSTWPAALAAFCTRKVVDPSGAVYCYQQGTTAASPHVAGVAALIASMGVASPAAIAARLINTADPIACPSDMSIYAPFPSLSNGTAQDCVGGIGYNGFNGRGQVNALTAVSP